jgi:regulator of nucleoside diphosphate kinase
MTDQKLAPITVTEFDAARLRAMTRTFRSTRHPYRSYALGVEAELERASVVPQDAVPPDVVTMNSTVRIRDMKTRRAEQFTLVYPDHADSLAGRLSVLAPLGLAVLGARVGDTLQWEVPAGTRTFTVEAILYQPEAAGHLNL